ncbi:uncharacterized protein [Ptychodera flava]|uniref:uncharacterized protein isoform X2 n=1 Tax=Ptychodera flava TaxID=63121 RepID=UPI00396A9CC8
MVRCLEECCYLWEEVRRKNQVNRLGDCFVKITMELFHRLRNDKLTNKEKVTILNFLCESGALQMDVTMCCGGENSTNKPDAETYSEPSTQTKRDDEDVEYTIHREAGSPSSEQTPDCDKRLTDDVPTGSMLSALLKKKPSRQAHTTKIECKEAVEQRDPESDIQPYICVIQDDENSMENSSTCVREYDTDPHHKNSGGTLPERKIIDKSFQSRKRRNVGDSVVRDERLVVRSDSEFGDVELRSTPSCSGQSTHGDLTPDDGLNSIHETIVPKIHSFWSVKDALIMETTSFKDEIQGDLAQGHGQGHGQAIEVAPNQEDCCYMVEESQPRPSIMDSDPGPVREEITPVPQRLTNSESGSVMLRLDKHKTPMTVKPFKCELCLMAFKYKSKLNRHLKTHTGEKPVKCQICGKGFRDKFNLNCHLKTHFKRNSHGVCCKKFDLRS